ncbi:hypothetical protein V490_03541 [Pseudogymnoascus sp. VKM F-3557]|nr:hypothetical protein V490_03541 [Pseudogymnoascus sp. VKM F-3557]
MRRRGPRPRSRGRGRVRLGWCKGTAGPPHTGFLVFRGGVGASRVCAVAAAAAWHAKREVACGLGSWWGRVADWTLQLLELLLRRGMVVMMPNDRFLELRRASEWDMELDICQADLQMRLGPGVLVGNPGRIFLGARIKAGTAMPSLVFRQYDNENFAADMLPCRYALGREAVVPGYVRGFKDPVVPGFDGYVKPGLRMLINWRHIIYS